MNVGAEGCGMVVMAPLYLGGEFTGDSTAASSFLGTGSNTNSNGQAAPTATAVSHHFSPHKLSDGNLVIDGSSAGTVAHKRGAGAVGVKCIAAAAAAGESPSLCASSSDAAALPLCECESCLQKANRAAAEEEGGLNNSSSNNDKTNKNNNKSRNNNNGTDSPTTAAAAASASRLLPPTGRSSGGRPSVPAHPRAQAFATERMGSSNAVGGGLAGGRVGIGIGVGGGGLVGWQGLTDSSMNRMTETEATTTETDGSRHSSAHSNRSGAHLYASHRRSTSAVVLGADGPRRADAAEAGGEGGAAPINGDNGNAADTSAAAAKEKLERERAKKEKEKRRRLRGRGPAVWTERGGEEEDGEFIRALLQGGDDEEAEPEGAANDSEGEGEKKPPQQQHQHEAANMVGPAQIPATAITGDAFASPHAQHHASNPPLMMKRKTNSTSPPQQQHSLQQQTEATSISKPFVIAGAWQPTPPPPQRRSGAAGPSAFRPCQPLRTHTYTASTSAVASAPLPLYPHHHHQQQHYNHNNLHVYPWGGAPYTTFRKGTLFTYVRRPVPRSPFDAPDAPDATPVVLRPAAVRPQPPPPPPPSMTANTNGEASTSESAELLPTDLPFPIQLSGPTAAAAATTGKAGTSVSSSNFGNGGTTSAPHLGSFLHITTVMGPAEAKSTFGVSGEGSSGHDCAASAVSPFTARPSSSRSFGGGGHSSALLRRGGGGHQHHHHRRPATAGGHGGGGGSGRSSRSSALRGALVAYGVPDCLSAPPFPSLFSDAPQRSFASRSPTGFRPPHNATGAAVAASVVSLSATPHASGSPHNSHTQSAVTAAAIGGGGSGRHSVSAASFGGPPPPSKDPTPSSALVPAKHPSSSSNANLSLLLASRWAASLWASSATRVYVVRRRCGGGHSSDAVARVRSGQALLLCAFVVGPSAARRATMQSQKSRGGRWLVEQSAAVSTKLTKGDVVSEHLQSQATYVKARRIHVRV